MGTTRNVRQAVEAELALDPLVDAADIIDSDVHVDARGPRRPCPPWAEHDAVLNAAWMAGGVTQVRDYLDVTG